MKLIFKCAVLLLLVSTSAFAQIEDCLEETQGYNMLLIGNSFFRPYADKLDIMAIDAGFGNHNSTTVFRGGDNGRPINFWNDSSSNEHQQIKAALDQGNVEFFGMTAGHEPDDPIEGHRAWIEYALQNNPNITIFIAIPQIDFPADWDQRAQDFGFDSIQELYDYFVNDLVHNSMVDQLRIEFPSTKIFTIPTGQTSINLDQMNEDNELLDAITRFGPQETSLFTDDKGHQGDIIREAGGLLWLSSIYGVDLSTFAYDTGFNTDLHAVAEDIVNSHDPDYKLCFAQINCDHPLVKSESTYEVIVEEDLTYAEGLSHDGASSSTVAIPLKLDVYYPNNDADNRPVFMFIHGGGFQGGTKTKPEIVAMANYFASRGWFFASIDYRTTEELGEDIFTGIAPQEWIDFTLQNASTPNDAKTSIAMYAAQRDAKAALRWIVANSNTYNLNTGFITVGGASAGAISTIALGISNQEDFRDEIPITEDPTLSTTNLNETYVVKSLVDFWGSNTKLDLFDSVYGVERYDSNDPDLLIAHGTEDPAVLYSEAEELVHLYDSTGAYVELNTLVGQGHGAWNATVNGKSLSELSFDFLVEQQELILDDCDDVGLPIELLSFNADLKEEHVLLNWVTSLEINNDYFIIEKSFDNNNWEEIGRVDGMGNSNEVNVYNFIDAQLDNGWKYYRLKQIDYGGKIMFSKIESVLIERSESPSIKIYPNPTSNRVSIRGGISTYKIEILNSIGQLQLEANSNEAIKTIDISSLPCWIIFC